MKRIIFFVLCCSLCLQTSAQEIVATIEDNDEITSELPLNSDLESTIEERKLNLFNEDLVNNPKLLEQTYSKIKHEQGKTISLKTTINNDLTILLPKGEIIKNWSIKNSLAFDVSNSIKFGDSIYSDNVLQITANYVNVDANLTVFGMSGQVYSFYIFSFDPREKIVPTFIVEYEGKVIPIINRGDIDINSEVDYLTTINVLDANAFNINLFKRLYFKYEIKNNQFNYSIQVFDDGVFTYFVLGEKKYFLNLDVPNIYESIDGYDYLVNKEVRDDLSVIVVKKISDRWTIRLAEKTACVTRINE